MARRKKPAREKAKAVIAELRKMKLKEAAKKVEDGMERLSREIRRRTRIVGTFPDSNSALMLVCARLRHVAGSQWGNRKYMNMKHLKTAFGDSSFA